MSDDASADAGAAGDMSTTAAGSDKAATASVDSLDETYASGRRIVEALSDMEFAVEDGEFVCIVGPSGCGKTTLFRIIAGLEDATSGAVTLDGSLAASPGTDRRMVFQEYGLFPRRTVSKSITFRLEEQSVKEPACPRCMTETLELVGLDGFADAYPKELSGGMKQRVGITQTLAVDPELFLMDEPFGAVDAQTHDVLHNGLLDIWAETDKAVLFVTHDVEEAVTLANRMVVMATNPGCVHEIISVDIDRPRERIENEFVTYVERVHGLIGK